MTRVEDEWDLDPDLEETQDLLYVTYDPTNVTTEEMLELIQREGFEAKIRSE